MADHHLATISDFEHPAPHRDRVKRAILMFSLAAAPGAWALQLLLNYAVASQACLEYGAGYGEASVEVVTLIAGTLAAIVAAVGGLLAYRSWRATRNEVSGEMAEMIDVGHGRTRFLAMWGMMISLGFLLAIVFSMTGFLVVPLCGS